MDIIRTLPGTIKRKAANRWPLYRLLLSSFIMPRMYSIDFESNFLASAMNSCSVCGQAFPSSKNSWGVTPRNSQR